MLVETLALLDGLAGSSITLADVARFAAFSIALVWLIWLVNPNDPEGGGT